MITHRRQDPDHSILATVHSLLPGQGRLPADNPLPLQTDAIHDLVSTERAIQARPDAELSNVFGDDGGFVVTSPSDPSKGLIYSILQKSCSLRPQWGSRGATRP